MSAVIRVKRRINEEPLDAFVLNCKKRRIDGEAAGASTSASQSSTANRTNLFENADETTTVMKFAGTVSSEDDISSHIVRLTKGEAEAASRKQRRPDPISKSRQQNKLDSQENRFKVVNCYRTVENDATNGANYTVVDIVKQENDSVEQTGDQLGEASGTFSSSSILPNINNRIDHDSGDVATLSSSEDNFVFDLYLPDGDDQIELDVNVVDDLISIRPFEMLMYQGGDDAFNDTDESEDSNAEDNWRNDYPDTDEDFSVGEEDMRRAVEDIGIGSDNDRDLSSDESDHGREPAIHFIEAEDDDSLTDYQYLKRHGHSRAYLQYGRKRGTTRPSRLSDSDEDYDHIADSEAESDED